MSTDLLEDYLTVTSPKSNGVAVLLLRCVHASARSEQQPEEQESALKLFALPTKCLNKYFFLCQSLPKACLLFESSQLTVCIIIPSFLQNDRFYKN